MEQNVCDMVPAASETEKLAIQHVGNPGCGEPVGGILGREGPLEAFQRDAATHQEIAAGVRGIVEVYELEMPYLGIDSEGGDEQGQADQQVPQAIGLLLQVREGT